MKKLTREQKEYELNSLQWDKAITVCLSALSLAGILVSLFLTVYVLFISNTHNTNLIWIYAIVFVASVWEYYKAKNNRLEIQRKMRAISYNK